MKKKRTVRKGNIHTIEGLATLMAESFLDFNKRFDAVDEQLRSIRSELTDITRRVEHLEEMGASQAGFAKEIDHLLARVSKIEKHLRIA
ncbi:hypothetical protein HY418_01725 [Candidatus Kaiserbacteria bacterium]|nr:hypothetical protein [Candidatus Kaiserbacteria bacterium]